MRRASLNLNGLMGRIGLALLRERQQLHLIKIKNWRGSCMYLWVPMYGYVYVNYACNAMGLVVFVIRLGVRRYSCNMTMTSTSMAFKVG